MKKIAACVVFSLLSMALKAAPVGNPAAPELIADGFFIPCDSWVDLRIGYEGDFVSNGKMKQTKESHGRVDNYKQDTNSGTATLNILDRLDVYGVFGSSRTRAEWRYADSTGGVNLAEMETLYHFSWGVGARGILFEWGDVSLGMGGRYSTASYKPVWLTLNAINEDVAGARCTWREWQIDLDISYRIELFTPYIGVKYSNAKAKIGNFSVPISSDGAGTNHFENRVPMGLIVGCSLSTGNYFMLNVEGRLIDEEAVTISGDLRF